MDILKRNVVILLLMSACNPVETNTEVQVEGFAIQERLVSSKCAMEQLSRQTELLWDSLEKNLATVLPTTMPQEERENMLKVRNASLIRMFEAYPGLPGSVKDQVSLAEEGDKNLAALMKSQMDSIKKYEGQAVSFLHKLGETSPDSVRIWQERFAATLPCQVD